MDKQAIDTVCPAVQGDGTATRAQVTAAIRFAALSRGLSPDETTKMVFKLMPMAGKRTMVDVYKAIMAEIYGG